MAHTDKLLSLADQFPQAFSDTIKPLTPPEAQNSSQTSQEETLVVDPSSSESAVSTDSQTSDIEAGGATPEPTAEDRQPFQQSTLSQPFPTQFLALMQEFPHAFADTSEAPRPSNDEPSGAVSLSAETAADSDGSEQRNAIGATSEPSLSTASSLPPGDYDQALQRHISTFTWGEVQIFLTYSPQELRSIWVTVGKSGTEVQSLCEAISRLINLLLEKQTPIPEICRQIRGIRGADSEGLGPNRILGLADLIGKALHEAPARLSPASAADANEASTLTPDHSGDITHESASINSSPAQSEPVTATNASPSGNGTPTVPLSLPAVEVLQTAATWSIPEVGNLTAMLCPECSAELHHMNGCSGGACPVCGYSSCS
ncbi:TSCPD domain-containing protein [Acaryochloris thomasi]|nr:ribonucleotide reductase [Acaryochloris thomasi]